MKPIVKKGSGADEPGVSDHLLTYAVNRRWEESFRNEIQVVTAHSSGLLKEWTVVRNEKREPDVKDETETEVRVTQKRMWNSFHKSPISVLTFSSAAFDGYIASGGTSDSTVKVWNLDNSSQTHNHKLLSGVVSVIAFHSLRRGNSESHYLFTSGELSPKIHAVDLMTNDVKHLEGHISAVTSLIFPDNQTMISSSRDKILIFWELKSWTAVRKIPVFEAVEDMVISKRIASSSVVIIAGESGKITLLSATTGKLIASFNSWDEETGQPTPLKQIIKLEDETVVSVSSYNHINFHRLDATRFETVRQLVGELDQVLAVKFVGSKSDHMVVASNTPVLKIYSLNGEVNSCQVVQGHTDIVLTIHVIPFDRNIFVTGSKDNSVRVWRFFQNETSFGAVCLFCGNGHFRSVTSVIGPSRQSSDFLLSGSEESIVKVWRLPDSIHEENTDVKKKAQTLTSLFSVKAHEKDVNTISVSPNDQLVATGSKDKTCKIWSLSHKTKQLICLATLRGHRKTIWSTDFSPSDKIVLTASGDCCIKIWSLNDYSCLRTLSVNNSSVYLSCRFFANGTQIVSGSSDSLIRIWSVKTTEAVLTLDPLLHTEIISEQTLNKFKSIKSKVPSSENPEEEEEDDLRIWSLDFDVSEKLLTFGSGSKVFVYQDNTQEAEELITGIRDRDVEANQKLQNLLHDKKYEKALRVAIQLDQPFRCLEILRQIFLSSDDEKKAAIRPDYDMSDDEEDKPLTGAQRIHAILSQLRGDQLLYLMNHAAFRWNTNSKNCWVAQLVMSTCLPRLIRELNDEDTDHDVSQLRSIVESMISYSERHYARVKRLGISSHFVRFLSQNVMKALPVQDISLNDAEKEVVQNPDSDDAVGEDAASNLVEVDEASIAARSLEADNDFEDLSSGEETIQPKIILGEVKKSKKKNKMKKNAVKKKKTVMNK